MHDNFKIKLIGQIENPQNGNIDVFVNFVNGEEYVGSFFTVENILKINENNKKSGESVRGLYFWSSDMIIIKELSIDNFIKAIKDLLETGGFYSAFSPTNDIAKSRVKDSFS